MLTTLKVSPPPRCRTTAPPTAASSSPRPSPCISPASSTSLDPQGAPDIDIGVITIRIPTARNRGDHRRLELHHPEGRQEPDDTKKLVKFLASRTTWLLHRHVPARVSAMKLPRFDDPILANFKAMLPFGRRVPGQKNWIPITQAYFDGSSASWSAISSRRNRWTRPTRISRRCSISRLIGS